MKTTKWWTIITSFFKCGLSVSKICLRIIQNFNLKLFESALSWRHHNSWRCIWERPHKNYIHTYTRNLLTKHEIAQMAARVSPARPAGNTRKATRLILRRTTKPGGATPTLQRNAAYFCLSFARLSLAWLFALGRVLTWLDLVYMKANNIFLRLENESTDSYNEIRPFGRLQK